MKNNSKEPCFNGNLSRLTSSHYSEGSGMDQNKERYSENILSYSPNGAIEKLQRYGKRNNDTFGLIDDLTYLYNGNQIKAISDKAGSLLYDGSFDFKDGANEATEYFYDGNGALTKDLNKGIGNIEYDVLGNPQCITFANGNKTKYVYDADGSKLRTTHESVVTNTTDYAGNFVFEDGKLDKYLFEGGYCSFDANLQPTYHYYEKDHLGSIRMVVNENGTIEQVNHYYPFGGVCGDLSYNSELQRNKYIGKELDHTDGLDWYDHGARMYDAAKVSWDRMEPLYDKYYRFNPYLYSGDNPITFLDNDGKKTRIYIETNGLGHSFVTIGEGGNTVVYTYGRYGALGSLGSVSHGYTPNGEGVLIRKTGKEAIQYLNEEQKKGNLSIYTLENSNEQNVASFYDNKWKKGTAPTASSKSTKNDPNARVINEYNLFNNNCTTTTIESVNYKLKIPIVPSSLTFNVYEEGFSYEDQRRIFTPVDLKKQLEKLSRENPKSIFKIDDPEEFLRKLQ